jgi:hypothetical protein
MPNIMDALRARGVGTGVALEGDAVAADIRAGKKAMNKDGPVTGVIPVQATGPVTAVTADITLPAGIYDNPITVKGDPDKVSANIKAGANIDGVAGKTEVVDTTTAAGATAAQMLTGRDGFVNGAKVVGNIPSKAGDNPSTNQSVPGLVKLVPPIGYYDGLNAKATFVNGDLSAPNIVQGAVILGVAGTLVRGKGVAQGVITGLVMNNPGTNYIFALTTTPIVTGLGFLPSKFFARLSFTSASGYTEFMTPAYIDFCTYAFSVSTGGFDIDSQASANGMQEATMTSNLVQGEFRVPGLIYRSKGSYNVNANIPCQLEWCAVE